MRQNEFSLIDQHFSRIAGKRNDVILGIGDDCALLKVSPDHVLAVSIDTIVEGIHFFANTPPYFLGYKSLAVSLSDIAAMGATPAWITLALTLSQVSPKWIEEFCCGFEVLLQRHNVQLVGGNLSRGPLAITTQLHGLLPSCRGLRRGGAKVGDLIYVTGYLGDAGLALRLIQQSDESTRFNNEKDRNDIFQRLYCPTPRIQEGQALLEIASAAVDISDGLLADLEHILASSNVGATIDVAQLPLSSWLQKNTTSLQYAQQLALTAGDDYELCFTIPALQCVKLSEIAPRCSCPFTLIGVIEEQPGLRLKNDPIDFDHCNNYVCRSGSKGYVHTW